MENLTRLLGSFICACVCVRIFSSFLLQIWIAFFYAEWGLYEKGINVCKKNTTPSSWWLFTWELAFFCIFVSFTPAVPTFFLLPFSLSLPLSLLSPFRCRYVHFYMFFVFCIYQTIGARVPHAIFWLRYGVADCWNFLDLGCVCSITQNINYNITFTPAVKFHLSRWLFCVSN